MTPLQKTIKYCAMIFALILAVSIIGGIAQAALSFFSLFSADKTQETGELYGVHLQSEDTHSLEIELTNAHLSIVSGESFALQTDSKSIDAETKKGTLIIEGYAVSTARVILTVPEDMTFTKAEIALNAGSFTAEDFSADRLDFEIGIGKVKFDSVSVSEKSDIEIGVGKAEFVSSYFANTETELGIGKLAYQGTLSGKCSFDLGITHSEFEYFLGGEDGGYSYECGIGYITLDGKNFGQTLTASSDDKSNFVKAENGIGTINIRTLEQY